MQAKVNISPQQRSALEATYVALTGAIAFLQESQDKFTGDERTSLDNFAELARLARHKLIAAFPELLEWEREP